MLRKTLNSVSSYRFYVVIIKGKCIGIFQLDQMQLGLPSRDYYLKSSSEGDMEAYHKYMTNVAVLLGANKTTASDELKLVVDFEKKLANVRLT